MLQYYYYYYIICGSGEADRVAIRVKAMSWARVDAIIVHHVVLNLYVGSL